MTNKAKRKLMNFNFEQEGAHVALVGKHQGGPANGYTTLVTKATDGIPESFLEKADKIRVTMTMQDFLMQFFAMYYEDAEILAQILGFDSMLVEEVGPSTYQEFIKEKVDSVEVMTNLFTSGNLAKGLTEISEDKFEKLLQDQQMIEKAMSSLSEGSEGGVSKQNVEKTKEDVTEMVEDNQEVVQKSELDSIIEKAVAPLRTELEKANETIEAYKAKEKEQVAATRKAALKDAVKDEEKAEALFKSLEGVSDEAFESTVETLKSLTAASDESEMMVEKGVDTEVTQPAKNDATRKYLEKQFAAK